MGRAIEAAARFMSKYPHSSVEGKDLLSGERAAAEYKLDLGRPPNGVAA